MNEGPAAKSFKELPWAASDKDFRVMLEKQKDIEAVTVCTPDHGHTAAAIPAMKLGKHVYCRKPLSHSVWEAREMAPVAAETKVATPRWTTRRTPASRSAGAWSWPAQGSSGRCTRSMP